MALVIDPQVATTLSNTAKQQLANMSEEEQLAFASEYQLKSRGVGSMVALAILFPIQLFFLKKTGLAVFFFLTGGGMFLWWFIEIFLTSGRVRKFNDELAADIITNIKVLNG